MGAGRLRLLLSGAEPCVAGLGSPRQQPGRLGPERRCSHPALRRASGCVRGGSAKLPVPRSSCFRREPEDAVCGRNSGPRDGRPAARNWKVSSEVGLATPARLGSNPEGGGQYRLLGAWGLGPGAEFTPREETALLGHPSRIWRAWERPV